MSDVKKYVVIGNGTAAVGCIEGIRSVDGEGSITVVSGESRHVYCRPLISYYLEGKTDLERMKYRPDDFYAENGCEVLYGVKATAIDCGAKTIALDNGESLSYNELCVAAGSSPFVPPMKGLETVEKKFGFMTLDDTLELEKAITPDSRVLIVGAGLIGLKCAEGICGRVAGITVCDLADRVLSSILDNASAAVVQRKLEENGIGFLLSDSVSEFDGGRAVMKSGVVLDFDILVLAVGVRANSSLVRDAGGICGRGIDVDDRMKTSLDCVYAAGDCTESTDISDGMVKVMALLPNAYMQGRCIMTAGTRDPDGEVYEEISGENTKKLFTKNGYLTGFMLIGDVDRAGIYTSVIRNRVPVSEIDFDSLKKVPNLFAFNAEYRRKKLGGVV